MLHVCYTYPVSRMTFTDEYRACIWTSLNWRVTLYKCFVITLIVKRYGKILVHLTCHLMTILLKVTLSWLALFQS